MARLAGEAVHLVLDRWAVARPDSMDESGIHRRAVKGSANDLVRPLVGMRDPAGQLARVQVAPADEREHRLRPVSWLHFQYREIDAARIKTRWCAGLQPADWEFQFAQSRGEGYGSRVTGSASF